MLMDADWMAVYLVCAGGRATRKLGRTESDGMGAKFGLITSGELRNNDVDLVDLY